MFLDSREFDVSIDKKWAEGRSYGQEAAANGAANLGLKDVIKSLTWVQENIWAFGGDPSKGSSVTPLGRCLTEIGDSLWSISRCYPHFPPLPQPGDQAFQVRRE